MEYKRIDSERILFNCCNLASKLRPLHSSTDILFTGFMVGLVLHVGFEIFGMNKVYCSIGAACMK
jgi:hypothetical protein